MSHGRSKHHKAGATRGPVYVRDDAESRVKIPLPSAFGDRVRDDTI